MKLVFLGLGTAHLGVRTLDEQGNVSSETPAQWTPDPNGGTVAVGVLDPNTMEPSSPLSLYGDWAAAGYLKKALELLHPSRSANIPDIETIVKRASSAGETPLCDYCTENKCASCIIKEWMREAEENAGSICRTWKDEIEAEI